MSDEKITLEDSVNDFLSPFNNYKPFKNMLLQTGLGPTLYSSPDWKANEIEIKLESAELTRAVDWLSHNKILLSFSKEVQGMQTSGFAVYDMETTFLTEEYVFSPGVLISEPFFLPKLNKIGFNRLVDNSSSKLLPTLYFMDLTSKKITSVSESLRYTPRVISSPSENLLLLYYSRGQLPIVLLNMLSLKIYEIGDYLNGFFPIDFLNESDLILYYKNNDNFELPKKPFKLNIHDQKLTSFKNIQKTKIFGISPDRNLFVYEKDSLLRVEKTGLDLFGKKFSPMSLQFGDNHFDPTAEFSPDNRYVNYRCFCKDKTSDNEPATYLTETIIDLQERKQFFFPPFHFRWRPLPRGDLK